MCWLPRHFFLIAVAGLWKKNLRKGEKWKAELIRSGIIQWQSDVIKT